jgi:ribosome-interacting GTPase 1
VDKPYCTKCYHKANGNRRGKLRGQQQKQQQQLNNTRSLSGKAEYLFFVASEDLFQVAFLQEPFPEMNKLMLNI